MAFSYALDRNNVYKEGAEQLPVDKAYVCKIIGAKEVDYTTDSGYRVHRLDVALDVCEGEYSGYYQKRFDADQNEDKKWKGVVKLNIPKGDGTEQDGWTIKSFNTALCNIEDSNAGYTWDNVLDHLKGKLIGLVLRNREFDVNGKTGFYSEPFKLITVEDARANKFRAPQTKYLNNGAAPSVPATTSTDFLNVPSGTESEIPF